MSIRECSRAGLIGVEGFSILSSLAAKRTFAKHPKRSHMVSLIPTAAANKSWLAVESARRITEKNNNNKNDSDYQY